MIISVRSPRSLPRSDDNHYEKVGETLTGLMKTSAKKNLAVTDLANTDF